MIRPTGSRIVVKPDRRPEATEGGILIPGNAYETPPMSGVVLAVGDWPGTLRRVYARALMDAIREVEAVEQLSPAHVTIQLLKDALGRLLLEAPAPEHHVSVGQRVVFPMEAGHEIVLNEATDEAYVILNEDSVLAVYEEQAA